MRFLRCDHGGIFMKNKKNRQNTQMFFMIVQIVMLAIIIIQIGVLQSSIGTTDDSEIIKIAPTEVAAKKTSPSIPAGAADFSDDDAVKGDADAPVTIVEWSDFECSFCTRFYSQTLPLIEQNYINTGKVKLIYRDYPLPFHSNAQKAAEAAECAGEQDKFWEMHDMLFDKGVSGGVTAFKQFATDLELNTQAFNDCLDSGEMASEVQKDMSAGQAAGVRGTPGFLINGELISGAQPYAVFEQAIEAALN